MARLFAFAALLVLALVAARWFLPIGPAQAIDGGTLEVGRQRIALYGLQVPPEGQFCGMLPCSHLARRELARLVEDRYVFCLPYDRDPEGIYRGLCWAGRVELSDAMLRAGLAVAGTHRPPPARPETQRAPTPSSAEGG